MKGITVFSPTEFITRTPFHKDKIKQLGHHLNNPNVIDSEMLRLVVAIKSGQQTILNNLGMRRDYCLLKIQDSPIMKGES